MVPARWYFCPKGALPWKGIHGAESSVWLRTGEVNYDWGEVWPRGPWDRGLNPGYRGLCYVGERHWFDDGQLPADILTRPAPAWAACCRVEPAAGSLLLGGGATAIAVPVAGSSAGSSGGAVEPVIPPLVVMDTAAGDLLLGGGATAIAVVAGAGSYSSAGATVDHAVATGGLVLGGGATALAVVHGAGSASSGGSSATATVGLGITTGGLLLGGGATALAVAHGAGGGSSGGSSGGSGGGLLTSCPACPSGAAAEWTYTLVGLTNTSLCTDCPALNTTWTLLYAGACTWAVSYTVCGAPNATTLTVTSLLVTLAFGFTGAFYSATNDGWDCQSPITLTLGPPPTSCASWPATLTIYPV